MARICNHCSYYTERNEEAQCPQCRGPLRVTLLPAKRPAAAGSPAGVLATGAPRRAPEPDTPLLPSSHAPVPVRKRQPPPGSKLLALDDFLTKVLFRPKILLFVFAPLLALASLAVLGIPSEGESLAEKYERIQFGMTEQEVWEVIEEGREGRVPAPPDPASKVAEENYEIVWEEHGAKIILEFRNGKLINKSATGLETEDEEEDGDDMEGPEEGEEDDDPS
jgi:hypothetical protein